MRGRYLCLVLVLTTLPCVGWAQSFSFGFASGGGGHHHGGHHGCYGGRGNFYAFDFYRPPVYRYPPVVYAPPPVTYVYPAPAVQVVQPVQPVVTQVAPSPGLSVADTAPSLASQPASGSAVRLNSLPTQQQRENAGSVAFRVQDQVDAELGPGTSRTWSDRTNLTVEFDRGGEFGSARKILRPGAYEFVITEQGWDLVSSVTPVANGRAASVQKNALPGRR